MARLTPAGLRSLMRDTLLAAGGRGFVRFARSGEGLLVTDALRRADEVQRARLLQAMEAAGFVHMPEADGLLSVLPGDALLAQMDGDMPCAEIDWESSMHGVLSLGKRLAGHVDASLTEEGRRLVCITLRLLWQEDAQVIGGLDAVRAQAAAMQRMRDEGGLALCGRLLVRRALGER